MILGTALTASVDIDSSQAETSAVDESEVLIGHDAEVNDRNSTLSAEIISYREYPSGWDGHDSLGPSEATIAEALKFIDKIPFGVSPPEPMIANDGEIGFFWRTKSGYIDIGFRGVGKIFYFARVDGDVAEGPEPYSLDGALSKQLMRIIEKI